MVNVDYLRPGDLVFGRNQRDISGRWEQPLYEVVRIGDDMIVVKKRNTGEEPPAIQPMDPWELYPVRTTMNYLRKQIAGLRTERDTLRALVIKLAAAAVRDFPELAEQLGESLQEIANDGAYKIY